MASLRGKQVKRLPDRRPILTAAAAFAYTHALNAKPAGLGRSSLIIFGVLHHGPSLRGNRQRRSDRQ
jgi:hypothetical protein